jgi:hypothetical protein
VLRVVLVAALVAPHMALAGVAMPVAAQQVPDSSFAPAVPRPAFVASDGPSLCLDEGHFNYHTLDDRFLAFGKLARRDGFRVSPLRAVFSAASLAGCRLLVISNAQPTSAAWETYPRPTPSAFTAAEVAAVKEWVEGGGSLLLIADHMPLAGAAAPLAAAFGVTFIDGFAVKRFADAAGRDSSFAVPTLFRTDDGTLARHPIVRGREASEAVTQVRSFTGQAFRAPPGTVDPVLILPGDFVSLEPRIAWQFGPATPVREVGGWLQGATKQVGRGRAAFFGEAAMFSAQVAGPRRRPMGMNASMAEQNAQFVLNVLHWLARTIDSSAPVVEERIDLGVLARIRDEAFNRSQVMETVGYLSDVIGPRPQGSRAVKQANLWTAEQLRRWGLSNVVVEPWGTWGRGWERVHYSGNILAPYAQPLVAQPMAWSGSTAGVVRAQVVAVEPSDSATLVRRYGGTLQGKIVLWGAPPITQSTYYYEPLDYMRMEFPARSRRYTQQELEDPNLRPDFQWSPLQVRLDRRKAGDRFEDAIRALKGEGIAALLAPSPIPYGIIRVSNIPGWHDIRQQKSGDPIAALVTSYEQYGQMWRNMKRGIPVEVELSARNRWVTDDSLGYNTLAEVRGTDKADEYVMFGGHLDSWHAGTGATDNASGVAVAMEAMRILEALDLRPRRTIRVGIWTSEEGRHLGVSGWIAAHRELWPKISVYFNLDDGAGRIRGLWDQSHPTMRSIFEQLFTPLRELGVQAIAKGNVGGNEHQDFDDVGIPGFTFVQDPLEYILRTHHSSADTYERLLPDDLKQAATVLAWTAYTMANRDELFPRKPAAR